MTDAANDDDDAMIGLIELAIFNLNVAVFSSDKDRVDCLKGEGVSDVVAHDSAALASSHLDYTDAGSPRLSIVIKEGASRATWAHECSHIADFVCQATGTDICIETTEVRAYLIGYMMRQLEDILG